jgi:hypothetical protein
MANKRKDTQIVPTEVMEELQKVDNDSTMDKIALLADMLTYVIPCEEKSVVGSEPIYVAVFEPHERGMIKKKIWTLIERL